MKNIIKPNCFYDSIFLMQLSTKLSEQYHCEIVLMMGTEANKSLLKERNLLTSVGEKAKVNDLIICCEKDITEQNIFDTIDDFSNKKTEQKKGITVEQNTIPENTNLIAVSIPGEFVFYEVKKIIDTLKPTENELLNHNLCLFIFSDNVSIDEEVKLKKLGLKKNVLIMGPDCGTAIINGVGLGFANKIRTIYNRENKENNGNRGNMDKGIGIISAGGTGLQSITTMIHNLGFYISQAIGTGGRDLSDKVGGITTIESIKYLEKDKYTDRVIIFSKPPSEKIVNKIVNYITKHCKKRYIINFLGSDKKTVSKKIVFAKTTEEAVFKAIQIKNQKLKIKKYNKNKFYQIKNKFQTKHRKYIRGLYSGGSLCDEAMIVLKDHIGDIYSNTPINKKFKLSNPWESKEHTIVDLGDDIFTRGRPHPMIDFTFRKQRILQEANDKQVAVIMFDLVLGYGSNMQPIKELTPTIKQAKKLCNSEIIFCAVVIGTDIDPQNYNLVTEELQRLGVITFSSNVSMANYIGEITKSITN